MGIFSTFAFFTVVIIGCRCLLGIKNLIHFASLIIFALHVGDFINACYLVVGKKPKSE